MLAVWRKIGRKRLGSVIVDWPRIGALNQILPDSSIEQAANACACGAWWSPRPTMQGALTHVCADAKSFAGLAGPIIHQRGREGVSHSADGQAKDRSSAPPLGDALTERVVIGGIPIARMTREEMTRMMEADVAAARIGLLVRPRFITSANGSVVAAYHASGAFRAALDSADIIDADGMPLVFASRMLCRRPLPERTATTDFLLDAAQVAAERGIGFYFLGARPGVAARAAEHLRSRFPGLRVVGVRHGYFAPADVPAVVRSIRDSGADILWVGMGSPRQEMFVMQVREQLRGMAWIRTCGGLFDHYGGGVSRAPEWMQAWGLEWLYRAAREPVRLGWRYLVTSPVALYHLATKTHD